jgi:hypothetical protein
VLQSSPYGHDGQTTFERLAGGADWGNDEAYFLKLSCGLSGDLENARGAESGVSWTRFDSDLTLMRAICQMQDIFCMGNRPLGIPECSKQQVRAINEQATSAPLLMRWNSSPVAIIDDYI